MKPLPLHQTWAWVRKNEMIQDWDVCACPRCANKIRRQHVTQLPQNVINKKDEKKKKWQLKNNIDKKYFDYHGHLSFLYVNMVARFRVLCYKACEQLKCLSEDTNKM